MKIVKEFEIDLTSSNDCEFVLDILKNTKAIGEIYSCYYDSADHMTSVIYVNDEQYDELLAKFPIFENINFDEYELDDDCNTNLIEAKKQTIDDIYELKGAYEKIESLHNRHTLIKN